MAKKSLTIKEVKDKKSQLEVDILKMVKDFEKECGLTISYISTRRKNEDNVPSVSEEGPITNVEISMDLDLVY